MLQTLSKPHPPICQTIWTKLHDEARAAQINEPLLGHYIGSIIGDARDFEDALVRLLSEKLAGHALGANEIARLFADICIGDKNFAEMCAEDLRAIVDRDPAAGGHLVPFLFFKGFHALEAYRFSHALWLKGKRFLAFFIQNRISDLFSVDIHPAAKIGRGIMMDHATGIVIGETAVIEDNVSLLHGVTLGGTGKEGGDRHPKIQSGVMVGAGATILGNIQIGFGARVAAGSVVLHDVPPCTTVAGVPAKIVGDAGCAEPSLEMNQMLPDDTISK